MASPYHAIRSLRKNTTFKKGDVLVLFGELFNRGYANGLVDEAVKRGMTVVYSTVGRREKDGSLRALNAEELAAAPKPLINIPLEAGFDLEQISGRTPITSLEGVKLSEWENAKVDFDLVQQAQKSGRARFRGNVKLWAAELKSLIPADANILFAHLMAGGVPRTKIVMPLMNRAFKGSGDRYLPSEKFWKSDIGRLCEISFGEVTAQTFDVLAEETASFRSNRQVSYVAYGYHGTEVLIRNNYLWQTYSPYLQGWAKVQLEGFMRNWKTRGLNCAVYNCPEILTNSSSIFQGVEVPLYPLIGALQKESSASAKTAKVLADCQSLLKENISFADVFKITDTFLTDTVVREHCDFERWPQHSSKNQLELLLNSSDQLVDMHKDPKQLMTAILSEVVFSGCGKVMINDAAMPESPVSWINHDILAKIID